MHEKEKSDPRPHCPGIRKAQASLGEDCVLGCESAWNKLKNHRSQNHSEAALARCVFPVGCSLGASSRKIEGANQTTHEAPNEHP